ncbi:MAG: nucleotidyltransferase family protein [Bacteroides sp.]|nr:nucleotidyltransferase family protein [Bacteroides sp.]
MDSAEKVFLQTLRKGLWGGSEPISMEDGCRWEDVFRIARAQAVAGSVGQAILDEPTAVSELPADYQGKIKSFIIRNCAIHSTFNRCLVHVVSELRTAGIEPVLLKGQALARNWPYPELRQCGDIDLWVGEENYTKAIETLLPMSTSADSEISETPKHTSLKFGIVSVEIHRFSGVETTSSKLDAIYRRYSEEGLTKGTVPVDFGGTMVMTPADNFNAFYIFSHLWHHFMAGGIGLRQVCDWTMFLHSRSGKIDTGYLQGLLGKLELTVPWQVFGCIAVDWLGLPEEEFPFYNPIYRNKSGKVLERILKEGNFGHERECFRRKRSKVYLFRKAGSFMYHISRSIGMISLFPSKVIKEFISTTIEGFKAVWKDFSGNI